MQTVLGYYHYEVLQYVEELYVVTLPQMLGIALFALFVQTMVSNKFVGHGIVIGVVVLQPILFTFGWENTLYLPGAVPQYVYSDMNGYGHFVPALFWAILYWICDLCAARRGLHRLRAARRRGFAARTRVAGAAGGATAGAGGRGFLWLVAAGAGGWYYYNAHVLNEYLTADDRRAHPGRLRARLQAIRTSAAAQGHGRRGQLSTSIPERRSFTGTGRYTLQNKGTQPIVEDAPHRSARGGVRRTLRSAVPPDEPRAAGPLCHLRTRSAARSGRGDDAHFLRRAHNARLHGRQRAGAVRL